MHIQGISYMYITEDKKGLKLKKVQKIEGLKRRNKLE